MSVRGNLIVFEGADGIGKTQLTKRVTEHLTAHGVACVPMAFPGLQAGTLGWLVNELHHNCASCGVAKIDPTSMQVLHIAAHIDAIEQQIRPALESGTWVILDRFWWSTLVYGRILGARPKSLAGMVDVERHHWRDIQPVCIFLVSRSKPAREGESLDRHIQLQQEYAAVAEQYGRDNRVVPVSTDSTIEDTVASVLAEIPVRG